MRSRSNSTVADEEENDTLVVSLPNNRKVSRLEKGAIAKRDEAKALKVKSVASYNAAAEFALTCKEMERTIGELYDPHVANAHKTHKDLTTARKRLLDPLTEARKLVESAMSLYTQEQRQLAQAKADEEARIEREKEIAVAKKLKDKELVKELQAAPVVAEVVETVVPYVRGVSAKPVVSFKVIDEKKVPRAFLMVNEAAIKAYIKLHGMNAVITGVEVFEETKTQIC